MVLVLLMLGDIALRRSSAETKSGVSTAMPIEETIAGGSGKSIVYIHSPSMPLSQLGVKEIREAADRLGIPLVLAASTDDGEYLQRRITAEAEHRGKMAVVSQLVDGGASLHQPSVVVLDGSVPIGRAILGYKRAAAYEALVLERLRAHADEEGEGVPGGPGPDLVHEAMPHGPVRILWRKAIRPAPGAFFRRVPNTRLVSYDHLGRVLLLDLDTQNSLLAPGTLDFVPAPDGRFLVTPRVGARAGLEFYGTAQVAAAASRGNGRTLDPAFVDLKMDDQYPSVALLSRDTVGGGRYRVLTSWHEDVAVRDYYVIADRDRLIVRPMGEIRRPCPELDLSIPMLAADGSEISARDESSGTTKVFELKEDGCKEILDLGVQTSKASFSQDQNLLAFSMQVTTDEGTKAPSSIASARAAAFVYFRRTDEMRRVPYSDSHGLMIPEFVGPDSLLVLTSEEAGAGTEFRLLCCIPDGP